MAVTKTFYNKAKKFYGDDIDKIDLASYSKDSPVESLHDDYGMPKKSMSDIMQEQDNYYKRLVREVKKEDKPIRKTKDLSMIKPARVIDVDKARDTLLNERLKELRQGERAGNNRYRRKMRASAKSTNVPTKEVGDLKKELTQKLRADRLAKKELRAAEMQARLARLKRAEKTQMKVQRKISRLLNKKKKEQLMSSQEYRAMYGQRPTENDGNMLHTPSYFTSSDGRERANQSNGNILQTPNILLRRNESVNIMQVKQQQPSQQIPAQNNNGNILSNPSKFFISNPRIQRVPNKNNKPKYSFNYFF